MIDPKMHKKLKIVFIPLHWYKFEGSVNDSSGAMARDVLKNN